MSGPLSGRSHGACSARVISACAQAGVTILLVSIALWLILTWLGWSLVFAASANAVVDATTAAPATIGQRVYFAGYTLLTLGNGDYRPGALPWQIATVLTVANGFVLVTLAITYLVPVASAATMKRQIAVYLTALGDRPEDIVIGAFDGATLQRLGQDLSGIAQQLFLHQQRHLTYPVLHYFHSVEPATSAPLRLVVLDEALTLIEAGIPDHVERPGRQLSTMRAALDAYLDIVGSAYITAAPDPPPPPGLASLREADIPTVDDAIYVKSIDDLRDRRRVLAGIVAHDGWAWSAVTKDSASE